MATWAEAVDLVSDLVEENGIDCELGRTNIHFAAKKSHVDELRDEVDHLRTEYNYDQISGVDHHHLKSSRPASAFTTVS